MRVACFVALITLTVTCVQAGDITAINAPENLLSARAGALRLAPLTQRVWHTTDLLRVADNLAEERGNALRRLLLGDNADPATAVSGFVFATAEDNLRVAGRMGGIVSLSRHADFVCSIDTARSLYEQRPLLPWVDTAQIRLYTSLGEWRIGQAPLRWGGGYSGAMLLSDTAPPLAHIGYRKDWHLGKRLGTWQFEQMATTFEEGGTKRYVMARRLRRELSDRWEVSFAEAFKSSKLPDGLTAFVLPFYLYQHVSSRRYYDGKDEWFNYLADIQVRYRAGNRQVYAEMLLDDLQAPRWLTRFRYTTPRNTGVLVGFRQTLPSEGQIMVEVAHTDGAPSVGTYNYKNPLNRWRYRDAVLGHPVGTNRDMLYVRLDTPISQRANLVIEYTTTRMANAHPEVPVGKEWIIYLHQLLGESSFAGVRFQHSNSKDDSTTRWLIQIGHLF